MSTSYPLQACCWAIGPGQVTESEHFCCRSGFVAENRVKSHGCWDIWHIFDTFFLTIQMRFWGSTVSPFFGPALKVSELRKMCVSTILTYVTWPLFQWTPCLKHSCLVVPSGDFIQVPLNKSQLWIFIHPIIWKIVGFGPTSKSPNSVQPLAVVVEFPSKVLQILLGGSSCWVDYLF